MGEKLIIILCLSIVSFSFAHNGVKHTDEKEVVEKVEISKLESVNEGYTKNVKPIFKNKCFDCHSGSKKLPWYSELPIVGQVVRGDREEGLKHLDLTNDFPFGGHGSPSEDLESIKLSIKNGDMPPLLFKAFHWGSSLTEQEKEQINQWIVDSLRLLKTPKGGR